MTPEGRALEARYEQGLPPALADAFWAAGARRAQELRERLRGRPAAAPEDAEQRVFRLLQKAEQAGGVKKKGNIFFAKFLFLRPRADGGINWEVLWRRQCSGISLQRTHVIGEWPAMSAAQALARRDAIVAERDAWARAVFKKDSKK